MSYLGVGVSPVNVPVYHGTNLKVIDRRVRLAELVLRCLICGLGVLAAVLVGTDTQVKEIFSIQKEARFTDMKALVFLVIANGITAAYSLLQGVRCVVGMVRGSVLFSKPLAWAIFSGDQFISMAQPTCQQSKPNNLVNFLVRVHNWEAIMMAPHACSCYIFTWVELVHISLSCTWTAVTRM
ncbi:CASP-like protein 2B1 isoform X3 [Hevea brasiliensis]|uniref:CASP-like protein 2B1 isoform X3 n=1 Tax=Hevea brasiliensis TaxID=3981 RepID=UPI000B78E41B|nr:CASP-like protein 2B1 isoform X3 [Hevea brasiliensis]